MTVTVLVEAGGVETRGEEKSSSLLINRSSLLMSSSDSESSSFGEEASKFKLGIFWP